MPPHWLHAGPRSRPLRRAGTTGGVSVMAWAAARGWPGAQPATVPRPGEPEGDVPWAGVGVGAGAAGAAEPEPEPAVVPPLPGPAVSDPSELAASCAALRARTSAVRMPSSSWTS